jgi:hypothetical protein
MKVRIVLIFYGVAAAALLAAGGVARAEPEIALPPPPSMEPPAPPAGAAQPDPTSTSLGGYGELTLNKVQGTPAVVDLRRVVLFVGHRFSDGFRFVSELEVEHAVASSSDPGEFEVEQAYLDWSMSPRFNLRGGLVLVPVGIINQFHEPPTFNGVDRPEVDTLVIPSTWREPAVGVFGELGPGLRYQLYVLDGLDANGFTAASSIREGHQEAALARAGDLGGVARLDYRPVLGTELGLSAYYATAGNSLRATVGRVPVTIAEADVRSRLGRLSGRAEVALQLIGDAGALDAALAQDPARAADGPVSARSQGAYVEGAYDVFCHDLPDGARTVTVFGRYDYVDTQAAVPSGFAERPEFRLSIATAGVSFRPIPQIALKLDGRRRWRGDGVRQNEIDAAITWMF